MPRSSANKATFADLGSGGQCAAQAKAERGGRLPRRQSSWLVIGGEGFNGAFFDSNELESDLKRLGPLWGIGLDRQTFVGKGAGNLGLLCRFLSTRGG